MKRKREQLCREKSPSEKQIFTVTMSEYEQGLSTTYDEKETSTGKALQKPTMWTDERGNLKFVNLVVRRPFTIFFIILAICFILSSLLVLIVFRAGNPFSDTGNIFSMNDIRSIQYDSLRLAADEVKVDRSALEAAGDGSEPLVQSENGDITYWTFESEQPEGVFGTRSSIEAMKGALDLFVKDPKYPQYCQLGYVTAERTGSEPECIPPLSALNMYYSSATWDSATVQSHIAQMKAYPDRMELLNKAVLCLRNPVGAECDVDGTVTEKEREWARELAYGLTLTILQFDGKSALVENITEATEFAAYVLKVAALKGAVDFSYDSEFSIENPTSKFSRAIVLWGTPLNITANDNAGDVDTIGKNLTIEELEKRAEDKQDADGKALKKYIVDELLDKMNSLATDETNPIINSYYFMGALILDVLLMIVQKDGLLALFSLGFVFFWLRVNVGSWFLAFIGILEIFFSVPVAWFFFTVVFRIKYFAFLNSLAIFIVAAIGADDIFIFMDAYKQSKVRDVDNLMDLETRMSWVYRRTGKAMAITSATTCTAFLCTLITPLVNIKSFGIFAAFVILLDYVLVMTLFCTSVVIYHNKFENRRLCRSFCCSPSDNPTADARLALMQSEETELKGDRVSEFFKNKVAGFITKSVVNRLLIFAVFGAWIGVAIFQTTKLEPTRETEQFLDENHPLQKSFTILGNEFPTADDDLGLPVHYAWGLEEVNRNGVNLLLDPKNFGEPQYVETFDYNEQCQTELLVLCEDFRTNTNYNDLIKRKDGVGSTKCFIEELGAFYVKETVGYNSTEGYCTWVKSGTWKTEEWQVPPSEVATIVPKFLQERSCIDETESISARYNKELGWDGKNMRYASISVESNNLDPFSIKPEAYVRGQYDQFLAIQKALSDTDNDVRLACTGSVVMTDLNEIFIFMNNQAIYVRTAFFSSVLGVGIAFIVLLGATWSLHIALFAAVSIACVLVSVVGMMVLLGWSLGSVESILIGIIAGFSVDYVVHLAHAYESASGDTDTRIRTAFGDMGISVLNGMITSVAASIPLFFCQLQFFKKFGTFLCMVIAFSWLFANFAFMGVLAQLKIPMPEKEKEADDNNGDHIDDFEAINGAAAVVKTVDDDGVYEHNEHAPSKAEPKIYEAATTAHILTQPSGEQEIVRNDVEDSEGSC